jgi:hypothetical protein
MSEEKKGLGETVESINAAKRVLEEKSEQHGAKVCTISGNLPDPAYASLDAAPQDVKPNGQHKDYYVLCEEERAKGFVRPVRDAYVHVGRQAKYPIVPLTAEQAERYKDHGFVAFEAYPEGSSATGRYWTQAELDRKKCGARTTMFAAARRNLRARSEVLRLDLLLRLRCALSCRRVRLGRWQRPGELIAWQWMRSTPSIR